MCLTRQYRVIRAAYEYAYWSSAMDQWIGHIGSALFEWSNCVVIRFNSGYTYVFPRKALERAW